MITAAIVWTLFVNNAPMHSYAMHGDCLRVAASIKRVYGYRAECRPGRGV